MDLYSIIYSSERLLPSIYNDKTTYIVTGRCSGKALVSRLFNKDKLFTDEELNYIIKKLNRNNNCIRYPRRIAPTGVDITQSFYVS